MNIEEICKKYDIKKYTINPDGSIDVHGDVQLGNMGLTKLPLNFNTVYGDFNCAFNNLTSLEGCPVSVIESCDFAYNKISALNGCPILVGQSFDCHNNPIVSLDWFPLVVGEAFYIDDFDTLCNTTCIEAQVQLLSRGWVNRCFPHFAGILKHTLIEHAMNL